MTDRTHPVEGAAAFRAGASLGRFLRTRMALPEREAEFTARGFQPTEATRQQGLEQVGKRFIEGFNLALAFPEADSLASRLEGVPAPMRGFAYEGAAMALALLDRMTPWNRRRFARFLAGAGDAHSYMLHVGLGWAIARLPWGMEAALQRLDPLLRWLAMDGYGFHEGYFHWQTSIGKQCWPRRVRGYGRRAFDQGLGRCLWFYGGADIERVADTAATFDERRQGDLWAGIGLAAAYAGGVEEAELHRLAGRSGRWLGDLRQGVCFAAKARQRAGNVVPHTELACKALVGRGLDEAAAICDQALLNIEADDGLPAYEMWRRRIRGAVAD